MLLRRLTIVAALALGFVAHDAQAQSYPRISGSGENITIDYGPMGQGNLVGGGRVMVSSGPSMNVDVIHLDMVFSQVPREGFVPVSIGSGEGSTTIYVPAAMMAMVARARAAMPAR
jgi:hypothetical protein